MASFHYKDALGQNPGLLGSENRQTRRKTKHPVSNSTNIRNASGSPYPSNYTKYGIDIGDPLFRWSPEITTDDGVFSLLNNIWWYGNEFDEMDQEEKILFLKENLRFVGIAAETLPARNSQAPQQQFITAYRMTINPTIVKGNPKTGVYVEWVLPEPGNYSNRLIMNFREYQPPSPIQLRELTLGTEEDNSYPHELPELFRQLENDISNGNDVRKGSSLENYISAVISYMVFKKHSSVGDLKNTDKSGPYNSVDIW